jgi:hypothetical protein
VTQNVEPTPDEKETARPTPDEKETARGNGMPQDPPQQDAPNGVMPEIEEELEPHFFACRH